jgi:hypothetical protein
MVTLEGEWQLTPSPRVAAYNIVKTALSIAADVHLSCDNLLLQFAPEVKRMSIHTPEIKRPLSEEEGKELLSYLQWYFMISVPMKIKSGAQPILDKWLFGDLLRFKASMASFGKEKCYYFRKDLPDEVVRSIGLNPETYKVLLGNSFYSSRVYKRELWKEYPFYKGHATLYSHRTNLQVPLSHWGLFLTTINPVPSQEEIISEIASTVEAAHDGKPDSRHGDISNA